MAPQDHEHGDWGSAWCGLGADSDEEDDGECAEHEHASCGHSHAHSHGHGHGYVSGHGHEDKQMYSAEHGHSNGHSHGHGHGQINGHGSGHGHSHGHSHDGHKCEGHDHSDSDDSDDDQECDGHHGGDGHSHSHGHGHGHSHHGSGALRASGSSIQSLRTSGQLEKRSTLASLLGPRRLSSFGLGEEICTKCCVHGGDEGNELCAMNGCKPHQSIKTKFSVRNLCCDSEVKLIQRLLEPMKGVETVSTNPFTKLTVVAHCPVRCCSAPEAILETLNNAGLGAALLGQNDETGEEEDVSCLRWIWAHLGAIALFAAIILCIVGAILVPNGHLVGGQGCYFLAIILGLPILLFDSARALSKCQLDLTTLVIIAAAGAVALGEVFDAALVVVLFNLAKVLEVTATNRVSRSLRAVMQLSSVRMVSLATGKSVATTALKIGDVVTLRPGEECPADGKVTRGQASCSEAALTGEARPVEKSVGSWMTSGTLVLNGYLEITVDKDAGDSALMQLEEQVQEAQMQRTGKQIFLERFAAVWTPFVLAIVIVVCTLVPFFTDKDYRSWINKGLVILLTACPCAIVIGAPLATTCAIAAAATKGLFIKRPDTVELLPTVVAAGLDKTGTLTTGEFGVRVQEKFCNSSFNADVMKLAAALEMKSAHPIAAAIVSEAMGCIGEANEHGELPEVKGFRVVDGVGIKGRVRVESSFVHVFVGNKRVLDAVNATPVQHAKFTNFQQQYPNDTTVAVVVNKELRLGLALNDTIREDAAQMVEELYDLGCDPRIFTGDAELSGKTVAAAVGIDPDICHFSMKPEDKYQLIRELEAEGKPSLMLGDGINDSKALAAATVGIAMGERSAALAAKTADMVMITNKMIRLPQCIRMCRFAILMEKLNVFLPVLVKLVELGFALAGKLELWMAIVGDLATLVLVLVLGTTVLSQRFWREGSDDIVESSSSEDESS